MKLKFTGKFEELKQKLKSLGGEWDDSQSNKKVLRIDSGVLNWYESTGTLSVQGKSPDKENLNSSVSHLIDPDKYKEVKHSNPQAEEETSIPECDADTVKQYLCGELKESELIIGIVNAVGTESKPVLSTLTDRLKGVGYQVETIQVSSLLEAQSLQVSEYDRIKYYMTKGDSLRQETKNNAILAAGVCAKIKDKRVSDSSRNVVYIVDSLKHPEEVDFLRKVYQHGFYLFGLHADEERRRDYLVRDKQLGQEEANELIRIDEDEKISHGQRTRDTFHLSDFFMRVDENNDHAKNSIQRFLELIFSNPFKNPTFDEFAMFMAFNSSIRSADLSRQVGAVITHKKQIIATGANDVPKYGGGQYWAEADPQTGEVKDSPDGKDYTQGEDPNKVAQDDIIDGILKNLKAKDNFDKKHIEDVEKALKHSKISDLTEFGRVVHAEMDAILSCSRMGISVLGATLYCTTFPCHNCAKHIIDTGITRVVYVEPYPKSRALELHSDSIKLGVSDSSGENASNQHVVFEPFTGVGARRFLDIFSLTFGNGSRVKRKDKDGKVTKWDKETATIRTPLLPKSYIRVEEGASDIWKNRHNK